MCEKDIQPHEEIEVRELLKRLREIKKRLVLVKEDIIKHRFKTTELRKQQQKDGRELQIPMVSSALQYRRWMDAVVTRTSQSLKEQQSALLYKHLRPP